VNDQQASARCVSDDSHALAVNVEARSKTARILRRSRRVRSHAADIGTVERSVHNAPQRWQHTRIAHVADGRVIRVAFERGDRVRKR
jgi:endonuclease YncB( thermonuclease family)